jgi:two-component system, cell cycle sensor histidine kinase and response regulator CckA
MGKKQIHILLIDDDEDYLVLTRDYLSSIPDTVFIVDWKSGYDDGLAAIMEKRHDIYLVDYHLGGKNGLDLIKEAIGGGCRAPVILLTGQGERQIDLAAIEAGADDYLEKGELNARILERSIRYSIERKRLIVNLRDALERIRTLSGLLPICANCKKIRDDRGYWNKLEAYIQSHSNAEFSHGICPDCARKLYPELYADKSGRTE